MIDPRFLFIFYVWSSLNLLRGNARKADQPRISMDPWMAWRGVRKGLVCKFFAAFAPKIPAKCVNPFLEYFKIPIENGQENLRRPFTFSNGKHGYVWLDVSGKLVRKWRKGICEDLAWIVSRISRWSTCPSLVRIVDFSQCISVRLRLRNQKYLIWSFCWNPSKTKRYLWFLVFKIFR